MDIIYGLFVWDSRKEQDNISKHGIDFVTACAVFTDPGRRIFLDTGHSAVELRLYCIGRVGAQVLTVRFTYRGVTIRIFGAGRWRKGRKYYEAKER